MHIWVGESWFLSFEIQWFSLKSKMGKSQESPEPLGLGSLRPGPTWIGSRRLGFQSVLQLAVKGARWGAWLGGAQTHPCSPEDSRGVSPYIEADHTPNWGPYDAAIPHYRALSVGFWGLSPGPDPPAFQKPAWVMCGPL